MDTHVSSELLKRDTVRVERALSDHHEHQEAIVEEMRSRYCDLLELEDDGTMTEEMSGFLAAFQALSDKLR